LAGICGRYGRSPRVIWSHSLPGTQHVGGTGGNLEIVLFQGSIVVWAIDGRFEGNLPDLAAKSEYRLVVVPLDEKMLEEFRSPSGTQVPWIRHYECGGRDENFAWRVTVTDVVGFVAER
jgi:hypothetical protein